MTLGGILMLRFFERYKQKVITWAKGNSTVDWFVFGVWVLIALVIGVMMFFTIDTTPASPGNYDPLVSRALFIQDKPIKMLEQRGNIRINDDEILLEIENKECKIIATYNREFELQEIEKKDKAHSVIFAIIASGVIGYLGGGIIVGIIALIQLIYSTISYYLSELIYKWKRKKNKKH